MHVTACLAGQNVDVEVGESCRTLQALRESIVVALPQLCVEGFDVSVGGRALDDDEEIVLLQESVCLDVVPNTRVLSVLALREAGREVSEEGLLCAAENGDVALVTLYLDAAVPLDCCGNENTTPLHVACGKGHAEVARLLLDRGSTAIDAIRTRGHEAPLHLACRNKNVDTAALLLDRGSTALDLQCKRGETPLFVACRWGNTHVARLLLDRGSAIDVRNKWHETPLHQASRRGNAELTRLLLDRGSAAIDAESQTFMTPLHHACGKGNMETVTLLLDRGSTAVAKKDMHGSTPLLIACRWGHAEVASLLLDRGGFRSDVEFDGTDDRGNPYDEKVLEVLSQRGYDVQPRTDD